ncbi:hypothetical protein ScPMuIL_004028 [Solemya velum]
MGLGGQIFRSLFVRVVMAAHSVLCVYKLADVRNNYMYLLLLAPYLIMLAEVVYKSCKKDFHENRWFSLSMLLCLFSSVPSIWLLELDRLDKQMSANTTDCDRMLSHGKGGIELKGENFVDILRTILVNDDTLISILEQMLLYMMIVGRWILPRGKSTRHDISQLLIMYLGMASDITELFALLEMVILRRDTELTHTILALWTLSLIQFTIVLTAQSEKGCFKNEIWSIILTCVLQDLPFLVIRLFIIFYYGIITYSIVAFSCKNLILLAVLMYRIHVIRMDPE